MVQTHDIAFPDWSTRVIWGGRGAEHLVLLHILGGDATVWTDVMAQLPESFSALAFDLRGQGRSTSVRRPFTLELLADDVIAVLRAEGIGSCTLVGVAFGGTIAQLVATRASDLVANLVLMDTAASRTAQSRQTLLDRADLAESGGLGELTRAAIGRWFPPAVNGPAAAVKQRLEAVMSDTDPGHFAAASRAFADLSLEQNAAQISCPTLILVGAEDIAMPVAQSRRLHALIPNSEMIVLAGVGHCPPVEAPALVADLIADFVAGSG